MPKEKKAFLDVDGRNVPVSNLEKVLYPDNGFTKADVIDYYIRVSEYLLPHLKDRPITLKRYPNGVTGAHFYEKNAPRFTPEWIKTFAVPRQKTTGSDIRYILLNDRPSLVWAANLANLEIHPFLHRAPRITRPTAIVFDCDPGEGADVLTCARVAFMLREILAERGLDSFAKVSGSKGFQVYAPLNTAVTYDQTQPFAKEIADLMAKREPHLVVAEMAKALRKGKVLIDWSQNADFKTTVAVYSLRATNGPPFVSMPVQWNELEKAVKNNKRDPLYFSPETALQRIAKLGDLFAPVLTMKQKLPSGKIPMSLERYKKKRDFAKTREPAPSPVRPRQRGNRFVIQKHDASHLHYDFRLEMNNVLKSWAVPKGPPFARADRRLAIMTEDHPLGYIDFEGTIPRGQYGGGVVMVWDIGTYEVLDGTLAEGRLRFRLEGHKLTGEWLLTRSGKTGRESWYLIKVGANMRPVSKKQDDSSAISGRSMNQIKKSAA